jgi:hypothetical protein
MFLVWFFFFFFFVVGLGFDLRASLFAEQVLYPLNHTSSLLCSGYFWRWGSLMNYLSGLSLNLDPPGHSLPSNVTGAWPDALSFEGHISNHSQ